uniref:Reverse transcriptase domain-containing protein n=1 Tax=Tremella fuciformis TaxID=64657 RepID=A0A2H4QBU4_9TREE|nr:hypothetical protein [Tremella fuciformis]ATX62001.1 hypothetical protein [Tremella fuciformis]ATX62048.1 hypothetical protein [Tremella fuciformis]
MWNLTISITMTQQQFLILQSMGPNSMMNSYDRAFLQLNPYAWAHLRVYEYNGVKYYTCGHLYTLWGLLHSLNQVIIVPPYSYFVPRDMHPLTWYSVIIALIITGTILLASLRFILESEVTSEMTMMAGLPVRIIKSNGRSDEKLSTDTNEWSKLDWNRINQVVSKLQRRITKAAMSNDMKQVMKLQRIIVRTFEARALAIKQVTSTSGGNTPGIDKQVWSDDSAKMDAVLKLKDLSDYEPKPVRRIYIPKSNGKLRPLGIPTLFDRAVQALYLLALDPVAEAKADKMSYGFRKGRSTHQAVQMAMNCLRPETKFNGGATWVLDADIKGFFDNISHDWIINNIPMDKRILGKFLKAGFLEPGVDTVSATDTGVPQGGVISPTIANMVLDGLEGCVYNAARRVKYNAGVTVVRYADDFVVFARSEAMLIVLRKTINLFLKDRGLELSDEKTKVINLGKLGTRMKFLGFELELVARKGKPGVMPMLRASEGSVESVKLKLKRLFARENSIQNSFNLVNRMNPIIRGWANYFRIANASILFRKLDQYVWWQQFEWAQFKFPRSRKDRMVEKCFSNGRFVGVGRGITKPLIGVLFTDTKIQYFRGDLWPKNPYLDNVKPMTTPKVSKPGVNPQVKTGGRSLRGTK